MGTIIRLSDKQEIIVARREECWAAARPDTTASTLLTTTSLRFDRTSRAESLAVPIYGRISGAFADHRVYSIDVKLQGAFEIATSEVSLRTAVALPTFPPACRQSLSESNNLVLMHVIGVQGLGYTFKDSSDREMRIDAGLTDKIGVSGSDSLVRVDSGTLVESGARLLGYVAMPAKELLSSGGIGLRSLSGSARCWAGDGLACLAYADSLEPSCPMTAPRFAPIPVCAAKIQCYTGRGYALLQLHEATLRAAQEDSSTPIGQLARRQVMESQGRLSQYQLCENQSPQ